MVADPCSWCTAPLLRRLPCRIGARTGKKISGIGDYMDALADNQPGDVVQVQVKRGTSNVKLKVKLEGK